MKAIFSARDSLGRHLILYAAVLSLALTGLVAMYGASSVSAWHQLGDADYYIRRQFLLFLLGIVSLFVMATLPLSWLHRNATWIALIALFCTGNRAGCERQSRELSTMAGSGAGFLSAVRVC